MAKKANPFIEKMEEKTGKDLDNDGEKGESSAHKKKVLGANNPGKMKRVGGNDIMPKAKPKVPPMKGGKKMCGACMSAKKSSCSHQ
jgi:hypothetical protein